ncbi:MAG: hypothetical protein JNL39_10175 [Opitutaceae bacterium]|nr:hypothetical protein [Opitutaceae bacterium]
MDDPAARPATESTPSRAPLRLGVAAAAVCVAFAAFTGHMWEDYLITFRASLNLATGNGLVFQPGERVHSFTSPLGTLLPALFAIGGGENVELRALWLLRLASAAAFGTAVWLAMRSLLRTGVAPVAAIAAGVAWLLDAKTVDFSINGMETALLVLGVVLSWRAFAEGAKLWPCALGCALLEWTRPDGCVYFAALALAWLLVGARGPWSARLVAIAKPIAVAIALYLPWFVFAWAYYGSPVPHTILAKSGSISAGEIATSMALYPWRLLVGATTLHDLFMPAYPFFGGWPAALAWIARGLVTVAALAWLWPRQAAGARLASLALFLGGFYVAIIPAFPWYYPGWLALGWIAWAGVLHVAWANLPRPTVRIGAALLVALQAVLLACVAWQMRAQQTIIEDNHRREIGRWLRAQAAPGDRVFIEPLGYSGYYSGLKMLDFPGLASPEVVAARRAGHRSMAQVIAKLRPEWVVLRPIEAETVFGEKPELRAAYPLARTFNTRTAIDARTILPGRNYLNFDAIYHVHRRAAAAPAP